jgi:hypothetical protein
MPSIGDLFRQRSRESRDGRFPMPPWMRRNALWRDASSPFLAAPPRPVFALGERIGEAMDDSPDDMDDLGDSELDRVQNALRDDVISEKSSS